MPVDDEALRHLALAFPEASEQPHHGIPSWRVNNKIFATWPDPEHVNVMLAADAARDTLAEHADCCEALWWGKSLSGVRVSLDAVDRETLGAMLRRAYLRRAPRRLADQLEAPGC